MGEKLYYLVEIMIFSSMAVLFLRKPQTFKVIKNPNILRVLGVVAIINALMNFTKFMNL